jgi:hypothetical protein
LFTDDAATVGDVTTLGADLVEPRESVSSAADEYFAARDALAAAEQELVDAQAALAEAIATASSVPTSSTTPGTTTTTTIVPAATVERVQQAEEDLAEIASGIDENTPLAEATAEYNSAAFALQISWMRLLVDAGCLDDEQMAQARMGDGVQPTQTQLQLAGYYEGRSTVSTAGDRRCGQAPSGAESGLLRQDSSIRRPRPHSPRYWMRRR